ncbi:MAG: serine hydrolase [Pseudomonadota bacterium]|nr:serine hydrolase [Pseudomonadota bacterium]
MGPRNLFAALAALILLLVGGALLADAPARVASAYVAKTLCSEVFVAGRDEQAVRAVEFAGISPVVDLVSAQIDSAKKEARASLFGLGRARARYREHLGCTIVSGGLDPLATPPAIAAGAPWPEGFEETRGALARVDYAALDTALDAAMADAAAANRAYVVIVDGKIVAERYADGFTADTPFLSWSMAKSVTATLVGAAALRGYLDIGDPVPAPEWKDDARAAITWDDLMRMQSGLAFDEGYGDPFSDVSKMLFAAHDAAAVAAAQKLVYKPGERWAYSSGTTNIIARALRAAVEANGADYHSFPVEAVFFPVGAASAVMEVDSAGDFIGSSYVYMTARDWARLGQLYLQDGVWNGVRILPEGWAAYVATPTPASNGEYGAQFWLNRDGEGRARYLPGVPDNVYYFAGHEGQYVFIVPDSNAVIVRTGMTRGDKAPIDIVAPTLAAIVDALGARAADQGS